MKTNLSLRRKIFYGATLGAIATLLLLPPTQWLAVRQLLPWTLPGAAQNLGNASKETKRAAWEARYQKLLKGDKQHDFALQYAHALVVDYPDAGYAETLRRLETLNAAYPGKPEVIASLLKYNMAKNLRITRPEQDLFTDAERQARKIEPRKAEASDPVAVARFVALAAQGESLEPQNAFFPVMRALAEFARQNDAVATAAWIRAGQKPTWDSHDNDEITARWQLDRALNGGSEAGAISRIATWAQIPFPQYAMLRSSARMASYCAWQKELAGDKAGGFVIRRASRQIGQTLQATSQSFFGNMVGGAIVRVATSRASALEGMTENPYKGKPDANKHWTDEKTAIYVASLRANSHTDEATAFTQAVAETERLHAVWYRANPETYYGFENKTRQFVAAWVADFLLLAGVLFSLVFAGIFKLVYRFSPRLQKGEALQPSARWGVTLGLALPVIAGAIALGTISLLLAPDAAVLVGFAVAVATIAVPPFLMRLGWRGFAHGLLVMLGTWASLAALVGAGYICFTSARTVIETFNMMTSLGDTNDAAWGSAVRTATPWIIGLCVLSVPLGLLALFGVFSKILRVPFAAGVTRGMRSMAVPLAAFLTLLWAGAFVVTLRHENAAIREIETMNRVGEIQYLRTVADALPEGKKGK